MKIYTQTYMEFFGYDISDWIPCECCGRQAQDIHHIWARSIRSDLHDKIENLMALCRICHIKYGDKKQYRDYLQEIHNKKINGRNKGAKRKKKDWFSGCINS